MTTLVLAYNRIQKKVQSSVDSIEIPSYSWRTICIIGFLICLALLIMYIWQVNYLTQGYYMINTYEKGVNQLSQENKSLHVSFAESSFLGQALERIYTLNFQKVSKVKYIQIPDNYLAFGNR